jgi:hypothetical protein
LVGSWDHRTQFWKEAIQGSFHKCPLSKLCPSVPSCIQDGCHDKKIEISSNGQNCSILSQKVPKFQLYKHNEELFNIYYGIFYELWTFAYFDRLCKLKKRGDEIKKKSSPLKLLGQSQPNFAEMILGWSPFKIVSVSAVLYPRWPPLLKIEMLIQFKFGYFRA